LTYSAPYVTAPSVLPSEVVPLVVPVEELTRSSSGASVLPEAVSEVLGISLSELHDLYFRDVDEVRKGRIIEEAQECQRMEREYEEEREDAVKEERRRELQLYREDTTF
jgi:hypothetical protein